MVEFLLQLFPDSFGHRLDGIKLLLIFCFVRLFRVLEYFLVGVLQDAGLIAVLELFCCFLHVVELFVDYWVDFLKQIDHFPRPQTWVDDVQEFLDLGSYCVIVFRENCLKDWEIVLGELVDNLIEGLEQVAFMGVFTHIEDRRLKCFCNHVVSVEYFLRKNYKHGIYFLVEHEPDVFQLV